MVVAAPQLEEPEAESEPEEAMGASGLVEELLPAWWFLLLSAEFELAAAEEEEGRRRASIDEEPPPPPVPPACAPLQDEESAGLRAPVVLPALCRRVRRQLLR